MLHLRYSTYSEKLSIPASIIPVKVLYFIIKPKQFKSIISSFQLVILIDEFKKQGLKIAGLGSSTKGNVILQSWNITSDDIEVIGDVNSDKYGSFTPGTWIPIKSEDDVIDEYDVFVILPWHFKNFFINSEKFKNKKLLFPLPNPEVVSI